MMPKSEHASRLAARKAHRADAVVTRHTGQSGHSWVAGNIASNPRYYGDERLLSTWTGLVDSQCLGNMRVKTRIAEGAKAL